MDAVSQRLNSYLATTPELRQLSRKAGLLMALQRYYVQHAPATLARASHVQQLEQHVLILAADNGAVAAKLRQIAPDLTLLFQRGGYEVTGIHIRVQVALAAAQRKTKPAPISAEGRKRLLESSNSLHDSPLKNALQRLARKVK
jgi:hypothetical protein